MSACIVCLGSGKSILHCRITNKCICEECAMRFMYWVESNADTIRTALGIEDNIDTGRHSSMRCSICGEKQIVTSYGVTCSNNHKGAHGVDSKKLF